MLTYVDLKEPQEEGQQERMTLDSDTPADLDHSEEDKTDEVCVAQELGLGDAESHDGWGPRPLGQSIPKTGFTQGPERTLVRTASIEDLNGGGIQQANLPLESLPCRSSDVTITRRKTLDSAVMTTRAEMYH
jgi:hypothetical protein